MTAAAARARCAELHLLPWDVACIGREVARASAAFLAVSPQVAPVRAKPGTWWVGAGGFEGTSGERGLATSLQTLARVWHPGACVAVADSCVAAQAATWSARAATGPLHLPPGTDADYLAGVPVSLIPMDDEFRDALLALGLRTAGALARLDPLEVERRWGSDGLAAWRLARGTDHRRAFLSRVDDPREVAHEFTMSALTMEPVLFVVRAALDRLVRALAADGLAAAEVAITLTLDSGTSALPHTGADAPSVTRVARPAYAVARPGPLFERCRVLLDGWSATLDAPVRGVMVRITETAPAAAEQGDLLAASWHDPAAVEAALERLRTTLGADSVVRPTHRDSHAPERAGRWEAVERFRPAIPRPATTSAREASSPPQRAIRLLDRPEAVTLALDPAGTPRTLTWRNRRFEIARTAGPERLSGEWWHAAPFKREYWQCESAGDGRVFLVYREPGGWRVQGWHD